LPKAAYPNDSGATPVSEGSAADVNLSLLANLRAIARLLDYLVNTDR